MKSHTEHNPVPGGVGKHSLPVAWQACPHRCAGVVLLASIALAAGCRQDMQDQPRYKPLRASGFFSDGRSARPTVAGTVPHGQPKTNELLFTGKVNGKLADMFPFEITRPVLERGRERFTIFCSPCHDQLGRGLGMIVKRGFRPPPSLHEQRLREAPAGHFFDVMTNGFGTMYSYGDRIAAEDRWAIVAYIRALQLSQSATRQDVPPADWSKLQETLQ